jgi:hypothetical protein
VLGVGVAVGELEDDGLLLLQAVTNKVVIPKIATNNANSLNFAVSITNSNN